MRFLRRSAVEAMFINPFSKKVGGERWLKPNGQNRKVHAFRQSTVFNVSSLKRDALRSSDGGAGTDNSAARSGTASPQRTTPQKKPSAPPRTRPQPLREAIVILRVSQAGQHDRHPSTVGRLRPSRSHHRPQHRVRDQSPRQPAHLTRPASPRIGRTLPTHLPAAASTLRRARHPIPSPVPSHCSQTQAMVVLSGRLPDHLETALQTATLPLSRTPPPPALPQAPQDPARPPRSAESPRSPTTPPTRTPARK